MKKVQLVTVALTLACALFVSACTAPLLIPDAASDAAPDAQTGSNASTDGPGNMGDGEFSAVEGDNGEETAGSDSETPETTTSDDQSSDDPVGEDEMAESGFDELLPVDPKIRMGQLENGLTYYIRQNQEPENRAELRLAVNAGSLMEDDDQLGIAHFVEHMLFNGTEQFEGDEIVRFLESLGMSFGPDLNAYTTHDETVYVLKIPTDDDEIVATSFDILKEWAANVTFDEDKMDKERGIIVEEWRLRTQSSSGRIREQLIPVYLEGSYYNDRSPIGEMDIIRNAPRETLVRFYEDWYRPDLMAVAAVGDFDMDEIEQLIIDRFGPLKNPVDAPERKTYDLPAFDETRYRIITDPENPVTILQLGYNTLSEEVPTVGGYRDRLLPMLFYRMLNFRLDEIARRADSPYLGSFAGGSGLVRSLNVATVGVQVEDDGVAEGLAAVLTEVERARRFGFTESELERVKAEVLNLYRQINAEVDNTDSSDLADEYLRNFFTGEPIPGIAVEYELVQELMPTITVDDMIDVANKLVGNPNRSVVITAPEKEDVTLPTEAELAAIVDAVLASDIDPYVDDEVVAELISELPEPAAIVDTEEVEELGLTIIELENGARVIMKPTDFREEEIVFSAYSPGGSSLVSDEDYPEADFITALVSESGVGELDQTSLLKVLTGKSVSIVPTIDERSEGFVGAASPNDLETLFQLLHLYVTAPRADQDVFESLQDQLRADLVNRESTPFAALQDATTSALFDGDIRRRSLTVDEVDSLDLERGFEIYKERFADMSDFTFVFVGSFEPAEVEVLSAQYIGTLPSLDRDETWADVSGDLPTGVINKTVFKGQDEQSIVQVVFHGELDATPENRVLMRVMENVLDLYIRAEIREERSGAYSTQTFSNISKYPDQTYLMGVAFVTDPERVDELVDVVFEQIQLMQIIGPAEEDVTKIKEQILRTREERRQDNSFWSTVIEFYLENTDEDWLDALTYDERVEAVTADDVKQAMIDYINESQYVEVVLFPEGYQP